MSCEVQVRSLLAILCQETTVLEALRKAMAANRALFVSLGAKRLEEGIQDLRVHQQKMETLEKEREALLLEIQQRRGKPAVKRFTQFLAELRLELPRSLVRDLEQAVRSIRKAAHALRVESGVGQRLLQLSEEANASILGCILGLQQEVPGYDRHARSAAVSRRTGSLISGIV